MHLSFLQKFISLLDRTNNRQDYTPIGVALLSL